MADRAKNINHQYVITLIEGLVNLPFLSQTFFFAALSMFSKEHVFTVLGVCFIAEIFNTYHTQNKEVSKKRNDCSKKSPINTRKLYVSDCIKNLLCLTLSAITLIFLRIYVMGGMKGTPTLHQPITRQPQKNHF